MQICSPHTKMDCLVKSIGEHLNMLFMVSTKIYISKYLHHDSPVFDESIGSKEPYDN